MKINIPNISLVALVGISGSGKSTFARKHFKDTEIVSSDRCRAMIADDENEKTATNEAFQLLHQIVSLRLKRGKLTVVDATNTQNTGRKELVALAKKHHVLPVAIVLDIPVETCLERNLNRTDREIPDYAIRRQHKELKRSLRQLKKEGFRQIQVIRSVEEMEAVEEIIRTKLYNDKTELTGPFDIIGDVHGCFDELVLLLDKLGYQITEVPEANGNYGLQVIPPQGRQAIFLGDLVDRGPKSPEVLKLVISMVRSGAALCVPGNHDIKLMRKLKGNPVQVKHGLEKTMEQLEGASPEFLHDIRSFIDQLISHFVLDGGNLVVAHAGLKEEMQGKTSGAVRSFCLFGDTTGETDELGLPVRYDWTQDYKGAALVAYGHTPVAAAEFSNNTINLDTGCVFGGELSAMRYPEKEIISVEALDTYAVSSRPFKEVINQDTIPNIQDVVGKKVVSTSLMGNVTIKEENNWAALETIGRFAVNPKWLIYLPPTMSPAETSSLPDMLEHPDEVFKYFANREVKQVICQEKHMGSRAVVIVCRNEAVVRKRFGIEGEGIGTCYTRSGRAFFDNKDTEQALLKRLQEALTKVNFWEQMQTDWVCLDCELMPWSVKAGELLEKQYAAVGCAANTGLEMAIAALQNTAERGIDVGDLLHDFQYKKDSAALFTDAYRHHCWEVKSLEDYKLAPFHILATEGKVHTDKTHLWHMEQLHQLCAADPAILKATTYKVVNLDSEEACKQATNWWMEMTSQGGEGMVVKPLDFISLEDGKLLQPALKCRGKEYLRIIYGPDYTHPDKISVLKQRRLSHKRSLAVREFALGIEGLQRFVAKQSFAKVHECTFSVLALESEAIDPRL
ncbi:polynucleotide kinase-phosphatase [Limibacter armeniacum]|uniref:polynucleotide kinase-phosphatase n=1 Tax=Limibacter armeniacum TaxID=466084 RepID=UPI002FE5758D